jgi:hypothetical protein
MCHRAAFRWQPTKSSPTSRPSTRQRTAGLTRSSTCSRAVGP